MLLIFFDMSKLGLLEGGRGGREYRGLCIGGCGVVWLRRGRRLRLGSRGGG